MLFKAFTKLFTVSGADMIEFYPIPDFRNKHTRKPLSVQDSEEHRGAAKSNAKMLIL
jgi:hypothetical protein